MSEQRLIDANALVKKIHEMPFYTWKDCENVLFEVLSAPTIEVEPVRYGEWENHSGYDDWYCSECGFEINYDGDYPTEYDNFKFCGCCGAKMDKEVAERELMQDMDKETKEAIWGNGNIEEPMTLEELLQMNGKPVFIIEDGAEAGWELAEEAEEYFLERSADDYGVTWFAYRIEPEGVRRE